MLESKEKKVKEWLCHSIISLVFRNKKVRCVQVYLTSKCHVYCERKVLHVH